MHLPSEDHTVDPSTGRVVELLTEQQSEDRFDTLSEQATELRAEQFWENRGYDEAEGHRRWEEERGVESFEDAMARSMGYLDAAQREASDAQSGYYNEHGLFT
jgi:hypothetical protein